VKANVVRVARSSVVTRVRPPPAPPPPTSPPAPPLLTRPRQHYAALAAARSLSPALSPSVSPTISPTLNATIAGAPRPLRDVFVHGWVYDIETGEVADLGVSVGPPGREVPRTPFPRLGRRGAA
jgi:hypothetical protein